MDINYIEDNRGEPLFLDFDNFKILNQALINDCFFLKKEIIIDYSLLIIYEININNNNEFEIKKIRMGIIDYLRKYTWDKQINHMKKINTWIRKSYNNKSVKITVKDSLKK